MNSSKLTRLGQQVKQFAAQFLQSGRELLGAIIPLTELEQWVREEAPKHRNSEYAPLRTAVSPKAVASGGEPAKLPVGLPLFIAHAVTAAVPTSCSSGTP